MKNLQLIIRSLRKNPLNSYLNIAGLAIGIAAALLIYRIWSYESSFNKNFTNYNRIVRIVNIETNSNGDVNYNTCVPIPAMDLISARIPQFETTAKVRENWSALTVPSPSGGNPSRKFAVSPNEIGLFADSNFFRVFNVDRLSGDLNNALSEPNSIILSRRWAEKCFDTWEQALGKTLLMDNLIPVTVKGVVADLPNNSDFPLAYLVSYATLFSHKDFFLFSEDWGNCSSNDQLFGLIRSKEQLADAGLLLGKIGEEAYRDRQTGRNRKHSIQLLSDLHYDERFGSSGGATISKNRLNVLGGIGVLIILLACFNFINLATAQATLRAKEVGVRKTLGSGKWDLIRQFMGETSFLVAISLLIGAMLALLSLPLLKHISNVPDSFPFFSLPSVWMFLLVSFVLVTLLAGFYPSWVLSRFSPVQALKSKFHSEQKHAGFALRSVLVAVQFIIAQGLIIGAIITVRQMEYIKSKDLGFDQDYVYTFGFNADSAGVARQEALKQTLLSIPEIESVSFSSDQPASQNLWMSNFRYGTRPEDEDYPVTMKMTDEDYLDTYRLNMISGRWLAASDTMREAVVNETFLRRLGVDDTQSALGQIIRVGGGRIVTIVGVVQDFHAHSLQRENLPLLFSTQKNRYWEAGVKIRSAQLLTTVADIQGAFDKILPEQVFVGRFLDERIARFYLAENRLADTCKGFGLLAIIISCLGLFGLAAHVSSQRAKEIGIRKILGASVAGIIGLLSKEFLILVAIGMLVAIPLSRYLLGKWLENFAYKVNMDWWAFLLAGCIAILIAFFTIGLQSIKAALANPINSLRSE